MSETSPMLCGKCRVPVEGWTESDGNEWVSCPICGQRDRLDDALGEASEYKIAKIVGGPLPSFKSGGMTIKGAPERQYRWIISD
jgi:hypothetical protein